MVNETSHPDESGVSDRGIPERLDQIQHGRFHFLVLFTCGLYFMLDSIQSSFQHFSPRFESFSHVMKDPKNVGMAMALLAGQAVGALFWGTVADHKGRKVACIWGLVGTLIGGLLRAAAPSLQVLIAFHFITGFCAGGYFVAGDLLIEVAPTASRAKLMLILAMFWTLGSFFAGCVGTVVFGPLERLALGSADWSWRLFAVVLCLPCAKALVEMIRWAPESPFWLQACGKPEEADQVLQKIAQENRHQVEFCTMRAQVKTVDNSLCGVNLFRHLFAPYLRRKTVLLFILWFCFGMCSNGIALTLDEIMQEKKPQLEDDVQEFHRFMLLVCFEAAGICFAVRSVDQVGRRYTLTFLLGIFAACLTLLRLEPAHDVVRTAIYFIAQGMIFSAGSILWVWTPELYVTEIRATSHGAASFFGCLGAAFACFIFMLQQWSPNAMNSILGASATVGAAAALLLNVETMGLELDCFSQRPFPRHSNVATSLKSEDHEGR